MKIDFKQLSNVQIAHPEKVSLETLDFMIRTVLKYDESSYKYASHNVKLAVDTLKDLKILIEEEDKSPVQQLNS